MRRRIPMFTVLLSCAVLGCDQNPTVVAAAPRPELSADKVGNMFVSSDPSGQIATLSTMGTIDLSNPFFQSLGTNGRSCGSCHLQSDAFGLSPAAVQARFAATNGADPLFAPVDGANCPSVTVADGAAGHSLLLNQGLIRFGITPPSTGVDYNITAVHDPYGCAIAGSPAAVSVYRRPLPTTNLRFLSAVMFDGRETIAPLKDGSTFLANLRSDLAHQAMDATLGHAQAAASPSAAQLNAIVDFELALFTAQRSDNAAGVLNAQGAQGGPEPLAGATYFPGINDPLGDNPTGAPFSAKIFSAFDAWLTLTSSNPFTEARKAIARGAVVFNTHPIAITDVTGLNDVLHVAVIPGTCGTCHDTPNVGNHSRPVPLDIGTSHVATYETNPQIAAALGALSTPDFPVFRVTCTGGPLVGTVRYSSDPGRALISGLCTDLGRVKGPILRGLAARAPYFHNGAAATLSQVVEFYNQRFQMGLTDQEKADLVAFLKSL